MLLYVFLKKYCLFRYQFVVYFDNKQLNLRFRQLFLIKNCFFSIKRANFAL